MAHLSSVGVLHYKAEPILSLERVHQSLQHKCMCFLAPAVLSRLFYAFYFERTEALWFFFYLIELKMVAMDSLFKTQSKVDSPKHRIQNILHNLYSDAHSQEWMLSVH